MLRTHLLSQHALKQIHKVPRRTLFQYINIAFNLVDEDRRNKFGPDRTCAEWLLRNGGQVKWKGADDYLADYNQLPKEGVGMHYIEEIDASNSSIMHYGFPHLVGCRHIHKVILHECSYLQNKALPMLGAIRDSLIHLQISKCGNISDRGLRELGVLSNLNTLRLFDLDYVTNLGDVINELQEKLPNCNISNK